MTTLTHDQAAPAITNPGVLRAVEMTVRGQAGQAHLSRRVPASGLPTDLGEPCGLPTFPQRRRRLGGRDPPPVSCSPAVIAPGALRGPKFLAREWSHLPGQRQQAS
jgi:hypothetical protein